MVRQSLNGQGRRRPAPGGSGGWRVHGNQRAAGIRTPSGSLDLLLSSDGRGRSGLINLWQRYGGGP